MSDVGVFIDALSIVYSVSATFQWTNFVNRFKFAKFNIKSPVFLTHSGATTENVQWELHRGMRENVFSCPEDWERENCNYASFSRPY